MSTDKQINEIVETIESAVKKFQSKIPGIQSNIANEIELLLKNMDLKGGNVANTVNNLKAIGTIQNKINKIILSPEYIEAVKDLVATFNTVAKLQNQYFETVSNEFKPSTLLNEIKTQSINSVVQYLTEDGLRANITNKVTDILRLNITTGASYKEMRAQLSDFITANKDTVGVLERYTSQITTDALSQFNGSYSQTVTQSLGLKWHIYSGSLLTTSREFCVHLVKKKYIYEKELPTIIEGDIDGSKMVLNQKTDLPLGMIDGTNKDNFAVLRGGYNCAHGYTPCAENFVPLKVRIETYNKFGIKHDNGVAI